jgi:hypothetical protein
MFHDKLFLGREEYRCTAQVVDLCLRNATGQLRLDGLDTLGDAGRVLISLH